MNTTVRLTKLPTEADYQRAREILSGSMVDWVAGHLASHVATVTQTPNVDLPSLDPTAPRRKMVVTIEVSADFEKRLDNQWMVEREIHADRWSWKWADKVDGSAYGEGL